MSSVLKRGEVVRMKMLGGKVFFFFFQRGEEKQRRARVWGEESGMRRWGSGDYRLSRVFHLWSKCTLAFFLSTPHMQLDSSLAKQTQMKWLLNDFLGNPPRQRKPSIWSLLPPPPLPSPLPLLSLPLPFSSPIISRFLTLISRHFSTRILWFACSSRSFDLHRHSFFFFFSCAKPSILHSYLLAAVRAFYFCYFISSFHIPLYAASTLVTQIRIHLSNF